MTLPRPSAAENIIEVQFEGLVMLQDKLFRPPSTPGKLQIEVPVDHHILDHYARSYLFKYGRSVFSFQIGGIKDGEDTILQANANQPMYISKGSREVVRVLPLSILVPTKQLLANLIAGNDVKL